MEPISVENREFTICISSGQIQGEVARVARELNTALGGKEPFFLGVLNGAFMFFSDLMKKIDVPCEVGFIKAVSYHGLESSGQVKFTEVDSLDLKDRNVVIVEDIVDTGRTLRALYEYLQRQGPASIQTAAFLFKKEAYRETIPVEYVCFNIENRFVLGYGLDFNGKGRNSENLYVLKS